MALEQWEIDLRKQLEEKVNNNRSQRTEPWEDKLQEEIQDVPPIQPQPQHHKKSNTPALLLVLVLLGLALLGVVAFKTGVFGNILAKFRHTDDSALVAPAHPHVQPRPTNPTAELEQLRADVAVLKERQKEWDKLAGKVKWNSDRIALVGMLMNENFLIVRNNYDRGHLIFFNQDWTIDQMPHYIELTDTDREYLRKFCKPGQ